jgi:spore coat polysaccharide biosynthesis protein SpsF (cytidylyltransferase family)
MSVREKGLWAQALKALDDARLSGEIRLRVDVQIDVRCCDQMLHDAVAAGCRYSADEVLAYTAAVATELALQSQSEAQRELAWAG